MKKEVLLLIICLVMCMCLVGCGAENNGDENQNENSNENVTQDVVENNKVEEVVVNNNDDVVVVDDDEIIDIDDSPNLPPEEDIVVTKVDESAEGLVFAYFQKKDGELTFGDVLTNYTDDFRTIKTSSNKQRCAFLGFKLDENDRIQRAYACVIYKGVLYAVEGTSDGSKYESNKAIMNKMYGPDEIDDKGYRYSAMKGETHVDVWQDGRASTVHEAGARISSHGKIACD